jgi:hypothetical protein
MRKRMFGFVVVALVLTCTQSWAATNVSSSPAVTTAAAPETGLCTVGESSFPCITQTYTSTVTSNTYDFSGDSVRIKFRRVLRTFSLTIIRHSMTKTEFEARLDPDVFPSGSTCYEYTNASPGDPCTPYDAKNPLPIKGVDYLGPVTWTLVYLTTDSTGNPALGHAKGTTFRYREDILQSYSLFPTFVDPTMQGSSDGLSSVATIKEPLTEEGNFCGFEPPLNTNGHIFQIGAEIEVEFRLVKPLQSCPNGTPIRDAIARLSLAKLVNGTSGEPTIEPVRSEDNRGNRFHFDAEDKEYEFDLSTKGLTPGQYAITVISNKFPPRTVTFYLQ